MKTLAILALAAIVPLAGCTVPASRSSEREWAAAECRNIIDKEARKKCLDRVDDEYGHARN